MDFFPYFLVIFPYFVLLKRKIVGKQKKIVFLKLNKVSAEPR